MPGKDINFICTYKLEDFFYKSFEMIGKIFRDILPLTLMVLIPAVLIYTGGLLYFIVKYIGYLQIILQPHHAQAGDILPLLASILVYMAALIIYVFLFIFIYSSISLKSLCAAKNEDILFKKITAAVFKEKYGRILLQEALQMLIITGIMLAVIVIYITGTVVAVLVKNETVNIMFILAGIFLYIAFLCLTVWLEYSWRFATHSILFDNTNVIESLSRSFNLVKKNWWRVFGNTFIINMGTSFAVSMVTSPVLIISFLPIYFKLFQVIMSHDYSNLSIILRGSPMYFAVAGIAFALILRVAAYALVYPVYNSLMFINLKVRKNEIPAAADIGKNETNG